MKEQQPYLKGFRLLLIVPEGIEICIVQNKNIINQKLLIVPEGIEIMFKVNPFLLLLAFNRTRRN